MTVQFDWHARPGPHQVTADSACSKTSHPASFSGISWTATGWPRQPSPSLGLACRCQSPRGGCSSSHLGRGEGEWWEDGRVDASAGQEERLRQSLRLPGRYGKCISPPLLQSSANPLPWTFLWEQSSTVSYTVAETVPNGATDNY